MDDNNIIDLFWERSEIAIKEIETKYGNLCKHVAINILRSDEDAQECVNDTYLGAWNAIPPYRPKVLSAFLCRITRNLALKKYEYNRAKKRDVKMQLPIEELENCLLSASNIEEDYDAQYLAELMGDFLYTLTYEKRNVFIRRYWFLDSIVDISNRFEISESKTKSMLFRTRNELAKYIRKEGYPI